MSDVHLIDLNFQETPGVIASYVFDTGDGLAIVDPGPSSTLGALEEGLERMGADVTDLRHLLLTHIHFDHAGATGTLLERLPKAKAYVHERGASHLIRPEKLVASATQIYGEHMERLWGDLQPLDPDRLKVLSGGEFWKLGRTEVRAFSTPGHAVHHLTYQVGEDLFVGDVGGIRLVQTQSPRAPTPPPDIDLDLWRESIATLRQLDARTLHLAHFGSYTHETAHWDGLLHNIATEADWVQAGLAKKQSAEALREEFTERQLSTIEAEVPGLSQRYEFACPPWMSVQGLIRYWTRRAARADTRA